MSYLLFYWQRMNANEHKNQAREQLVYLTKGHVPVLLQQLQYLQRSQTKAKSVSTNSSDAKRANEGWKQRTLLISRMFSRSSGLASASSTEVATPSSAAASEEPGGPGSSSGATVVSAALDSSWSREAAAPLRRRRWSGQTLGTEGQSASWWR
jgi:hypothetical protein